MLLCYIYDEKLKKKEMERNCFCEKKLPWVLSHVSNSGHLFEFAEFAFFATLLYI